MHVPTDLAILDERMQATKMDSLVRVHHTEGRWLEGPSYSIQGRYLLFSDIPNDQTLRLDETSGGVSVFDHPSRFANGRTHDPVGRLVTCLHGDRAVVRREHDGRELVVASTYKGLRLNSPNDVIVASSGDIWFTDPTYGIVSDYEGHRAEPELSVRGLYRWREGDAEPQLMHADFAQPNGLAFSREESTLYVVDSQLGTLSEFRIDAQGLSFARTLVSGRLGLDGIRVDAVGRIWAATREGLSCFDADGVELLRLSLPEPASNLAFGGRMRNVLYITATTSLYSIRTSIQGLR